ncbi:serine hydrolase domain-containing protein [Catellatospora vulcania]|uniref:serine hydrolase domain-containing protein n=1 Tax=Catellatospora vulcania TaxID=1460450 RepID=UPI0012D3ABFA|nr:serine hydrolase domain-containing protein [Catellatospora vulcania]
MPTIPQIPGAVLIVQGDAVVADVTSPGVTARTRFQIASVSKQFTAAAVLLQSQRGLLGLDDPVGRWIDGCPSSWQDITLHHLMAHSSGLGHWDEYPMIDLCRRVEPDDLLKTFHEVPPLFAPGAGWHYSSPAYVLLAHVVERVADLPYREVLEREIFAPLGLADTFAGEPGDRANLAVGLGEDGLPVPSYELDVVAMGAGDLWSTTGDLVRWIDGLRAGRLLDEHHLGLMLSVQASTGGGPDASGYGYGWFIGAVNGRSWFQHSGGNAGFRTFDACLPASNHRIVVLSNTEATTGAVLNTLLTATLA